MQDEPSSRAAPPATPRVAHRATADAGSWIGPLGPIAPTEWLALGVGLFLTLRYAWLMDDAFVFFRYVDNLLFLERGLVFNEGEYVEGFSSPAWTLLLIPLRAAGLNYWLAVRLFGLAAFALFWLLLVALRRAARPSATAPVVNLPLVFLAPLYPVCCYFTSGMETGLVQVAAGAFALHAFRPRARLPRILIGLAPLARPELAAPLALALAWDWVRGRRFPWLPAAVAAATSGGWLLFRVWYYADLVPNTFHLKDGVRLDWGLAYLHDALVPYGAYPLAVLLPALTLGLAARGVAVRIPERALLLIQAAVVAAYVVKIGGDGRHYRYLAFPFCLAACASSGLAGQALTSFAPRVRTAGATALGLALMVLFGSRSPRQLSTHPLLGGVEEERIGVIRDAQYHRAHEQIGFSPWSSGAETELVTGTLADNLRSANGEPPPEGPLSLREEYARYLREVRPNRVPDTRPGGWCHTMWIGFNERWIHKDGLTDAVLAHVAAEPWRPGHYRDQERAPLLRDLMTVQNDFGPRVGAHRAAAEAGRVGPWVAAALPSLEILERRVWGPRTLLESLRLALTSVPPIEPPASTAEAARAPRNE